MDELSDILKRRSPVFNVLTPTQSVSEAVRTMSRKQVGAVLVVEAGTLTGIFSERDLLRRVVAPGLSLEATPLRHVMTRDPITATPKERRTSAIRKMRDIGCRHLPILVEGQVIDMVSIRDLLFDEIRERDGEIDELKRYISGT